jgi:capsular polysaccharide biosynthesis protein
MTVTQAAVRNWAAPKAIGQAATAAQWAQATGLGSVRTLHPAAMIVRPPFWNSVDPPSARKVRRFVAPPAQIADLPGGSVWGPDGTVLTADGCVIQDITRAWGEAFEDHPVWAAAPGATVNLPGTAAVIAARGAAINFSHFLADTLPRIHLIRACSIAVDTWIVSSLSQPWQREGLRLAGLPLEKTISLTDVPLITAARLIVPTRTGFAPTTAAWARSALQSLIRAEPQARTLRLFISRNNASRRRLLNEDDVWAILKARGFLRADFDTISLTEQIKLIHQSQAIVSVHGSALGHMLHAPAGGHVIEITSTGQIRPDVWGLAALAGWAHAIAPATPAGIQPGHINDDLDADLHNFHDIIEDRT